MHTPVFFDPASVARRMAFAAGAALEDNDDVHSPNAASRLHVDNVDTEDVQADHEEKQKKKQKNDRSAHPPFDKATRNDVNLSQEQKRSVDKCERLMDQSRDWAAHWEMRLQ
jgi:hypothetical protein